MQASVSRLTYTWQSSQKPLTLATATLVTLATLGVAEPMAARRRAPGKGRLPCATAAAVVAAVAVQQQWPITGFAAWAPQTPRLGWGPKGRAGALSSPPSPPLLGSSGFGQKGAASSATATAALSGSLVVANFLPPFLGLLQAEYGVSYGYGLATAFSGALLLGNLPNLPMPVALHAGCLCFYGARLSLFLLYRELCIARFREFRDRIEQRSRDSGSRWSRVPFLSACAVLYLGLAAPIAMASAAPSVGRFLVYKIFVGLMCSGCFLAALGDCWKSLAKGKRGEDALVTGGPFAIFRHPNYTGEQLLWTCSFAAGLCAFAAFPSALKALKALWLWTLLASLGYLGIFFVLMQATRGLEQKQMKNYGGSQAFESWRARTWGGFSLSQKLAEEAESKE